MDEIISGIQVIKMYAWEKPFAKLIKTARIKELKIVTKLSYVRGLFMTFNLFTTRVALFCALITIALTDKKITASTVSVYFTLKINFQGNIISRHHSKLRGRSICNRKHTCATSKTYFFFFRYSFSCRISIFYRKPCPQCS